METKTSIIIATYNGAHKITNIVSRLMRQVAGLSVEVIVVNDGSTDDTVNVLESLQSKFPIRVIHQENRGRAGVRNRGAQEATGATLIFFDDDMLPFDDCVSRHISFHNHYNGLLTGNVIEEQSSDKTDIQNYKAWLTRKWTKKYTTDLTLLATDNLFFTAANCSLPKARFFELGGFDERLRDAEDYDLAYRAMIQGYNVYFDRTNKAVHDERITTASYIKRLREYGKAHKARTIIHQMQDNPSEAHSFVKKVIYRFFAMPLWVKMIDRGLFVRWLPQLIRYRFYSIVIQALSIEYPNQPI